MHTSSDKVTLSPEKNCNTQKTYMQMFERNISDELATVRGLISCIV